jgi:hypothetical protein
MLFAGRHLKAAALVEVDTLMELMVFPEHKIPEVVEVAVAAVVETMGAVVVLVL